MLILRKTLLALAALLLVPTVVPAQEEVYKGIPCARLEKILGDLKIKYRKGQGPGPNDCIYEYVKNNFQLRVTDFNGGDLMLDAIFPATSVAKVNTWNIKRHLVRAVLYPPRDAVMAYTALEANLDCMGGTSDALIRHFINAFDEQVAAFDKYLQSK
jgi:Putative bacterial sensory transduction regulator